MGVRERCYHIATSTRQRERKERDKEWEEKPVFVKEKGQNRDKEEGKNNSLLQQEQKTGKIFLN